MAALKKITSKVVSSRTRVAAVHAGWDQSGSSMTKAEAIRINHGTTRRFIFFTASIIIMAWEDLIATLPPEIKLGVTGTRAGATFHQIKTIHNVLKACAAHSRVLEAHHGDCVGVDQQFHDIIKEHFPHTKTVIHPPSKQTMRAYCRGDIVRPPQDFLKRNRTIVNSVDLLLVVPETTQETIRSGTWYTYRYAQSQHTKTIILYPFN